MLTPHQREKVKELEVAWQDRTTTSGRAKFEAPAGAEKTFKEKTFIALVFMLFLVVKTFPQEKVNDHTKYVKHET